MSTTSIKSYGIAPYYDDFDETKNYLRILFRPGVAVQARELTQMQTALQAQIDRHGQYSFKNGSRVLNGKVTLNIEYDFVKVEAGAENFLDEFVGTTITGQASGVKARVLKAIRAEGSDPNTLYVKYTSGAANDRTFREGESITSDAEVVRTAVVGGGSGSSIANSIGLGSAASIEEGVYFISGCFAYVEEQTIILEKYSTNPSCIIALQVEETIASSAEDLTLLDNAQGVPNTAAPGANRYQIVTNLIKQPVNIEDRDVENYITLLRVNNGFIDVDKTDSNKDTELSMRLARRTFEESGNYSVRPYTLDIKEHLNDGTNNGLLTSAEGGNEDLLAIGVEPSVSYVQGYRNENLTTRYIEVEKPRGDDAKDLANNSATLIRLGNFVKLTKSTVEGIPNVNTFTTLNLRNSSDTIIGTARSRGLNIDPDSALDLRLYLFDVTMNSGQSFANVAKVDQPGDIPFVGTLSEPGTRFEAGQNGLVFKLPYDAIDKVDDVIYQTRRAYNASVSSGQFSIPSGSSDIIFIDDGNIIIADNNGNLATGVQPTSGIGTNNIVFDNVPGITGTDVRVIATTRKTNFVQKTKTRNNNITQTFNVTNGNTSSYTLNRSDIIRIVSIVDSQGNNVTDLFVLDNGQKDNFYDLGKINKISGTQPVATGNMVVTFDHYTHGSGDYFTVDSYPTNDYDTIPQFNSIQGVVELRDCVDFRPTKSASNDFTTGVSSVSAINPNHIFSSDIEYFLPRIDKLYVTRDGDFKIAKGVPDENPKPPEDPKDSMVIYKLELSPYVFRIEDVKPVMVDNKRYTMRDIGALDRRIKSLEYYTSLSLLEQSASDTQLFDGSGFNRFKNGFLVDGFRGHNVGDVSNPDYSVSIDKANGILRPKFDERNTNLIRLSNDAGTAVKNGSIVTMPYSEVNYVNQPYSTFTENVNPYDVFTWGGILELSPDSDEWKDVDIRPDVIIDDTGVYDQMLRQIEEEGILGTVWNEWETNWTGTTRDFENEIFARSGRTNIRETFTTTTTNQARTGIRTDVVPDTIVKESGPRVVEINFVPFMRSRKIYFKAELLKPNTRVYPFFNGTNVSAYCRQEGFQEFSDQTFVGTFENESAHPEGSTPLVTNSVGAIEGSFVIPRNSSLRFKTGTREFRLSDSEVNNRSEEDTFAEAQYHAQGLLEVQENVIISTKVPKIVTSEVRDERTLVETNIQRTTEWVDPLAQTFLVTEPGGLFMTSAEVFFATKDPNIPVRLSIRSVENGVPTQLVVPGSDVVLYPSDVNLSTDATAATKFEFDYPVFLEQDQEYCIVLMAQSNQYNVYVAEMGGQDITNPAFSIAKQPYNGVFFTSQNASTWTPEQSKDLKFKLNRASFDVSTAHEINLVNDVVPTKKLRNNPLTTTSGSSLIRVQHKNHGMHGPGSQVIISGAATFNGVDPNGQFTIQDVEHDSYSINIGTTVGVSGSGGGNNVRATENRHYDVMNVILSQLQLPETSIRFFVSGRLQDSINSSAVAYQPYTEFEILTNRNITFNRPNVIASAINEQANAAGMKSYKLRCVLTSDRESLSPVIDMNRASVITVQNIVNNAEGNIAQYAGYAAETSPTGGSELAKYITRRVDLNEEADIITVLLNTNRPSAAFIDLYYKTAGAGEDADLNSINWIKANPDTAIGSNDNPTVFDEVRYSIDPPESFSTMVFKIVLRSNNSSQVPRVKDFRAIAAT